MNKPSHALYRFLGASLFAGITVIGALVLLPQTGDAVQLRTPSIWDLLVPTQPQSHPETMEELVDHIRYGNESAKKLQERFADRIAESAEATRYLGERFAHEGNPEQAIKTYEQSIELKPGKENLTALANLLLSQGDEDSWLATMKKRLDLPFDRWNDAETNHGIAAHFIETGKWEQALPYAEAAAMRGYWWDYRQAAWLNAALDNIQHGLEWMEQEQARWGDSGLYTYVAAFDPRPTDWTNELLDNYCSRFSQGNAIVRAQCMSIAVFREDYDTAASLMEWGLLHTNDPWYGLHAALICEEQGWIERRDRILTEAVERWEAFPNQDRCRRNMKTFIDLYIQANNHTTLTPKLKRQLQTLFDSCGRRKADFNGAYVGELCRLKGEPEMARKMYSEMVSVLPLANISDYVAFRGLRLIGEDPVKIMQAHREKLLEQNKKKSADPGVTL